MNWSITLILAAGLICLAFLVGIVCWFFAEEQPEVDDHDWMQADDDPKFWN